MARARLRNDEARRIALDAQGFGARPATVGTRDLTRLVRRLGVLQIDSVNVFERSHYLPALARLGAYDRGVLDRLVQHDRPPRRAGRYIEYWAHEAAILPLEDWPLWQWRRERHATKPSWVAWADEHRSLVDAVMADIAEHGPRRVGEIEHEANVRTSGGWWNKNDVHWATQYLFSTGRIVGIGRSRFERSYAAAEHVIPEHLRTPLPRADAMRELVRRASASFGIGTIDDLADYYRLPLADAKHAVGELVDAGELQPIEVEGWGKQAFWRVGQRIPRRIDAAALLSPFDPVVWYRPRALRMFDFHYRISIYTPAAEREHGYYVLPVLVDDRIVGRIDLKSDRSARVLRVQHANLEPWASACAAELARRIWPRLTEAAAWQGLDDVVVAGAGDWAAQLAASRSSSV